MDISADELFDRVLEVIQKEKDVDVNRMMHETLVLACHEAIKDTKQAFGNLFSQVDFLCKVHHIHVRDIVAIQQMRRNSNHSLPLSHEDLMYDARALCIFISAVFSTAIPSRLVGKIPVEPRPYSGLGAIDIRCLRCIVKTVDMPYFIVEVDHDGGDNLKVDCTAPHFAYLTHVLKTGMQLNLLDCHVDKADPNHPLLIPTFIVVEPDFLLDISSIAACFTDFGHHPLLYVFNQLKPKANTQPILLGNFAGSALDDIINSHDINDYDFSDTLRNNFHEKALEFSVCSPFDSRRFKDDAAKQVANLKPTVDELFRQYKREKAILEPSFVCESLGIQGRVDLMTTDMELLVEQKSGKNWNIERQQQNAYGSKQLENHYVQLLLYYGVLRYNFRLGNNKVDIRLLYSKYPPEQGLMVVSFYQKLFLEAIRFRNQVVAFNYWVGKNGLDPILPQFTPDTLNVNKVDSSFYHQYILPEQERILQPLQSLSPLERHYFCRMYDFVNMEQIISRVGNSDGHSYNGADAWNVPLEEKRESGNIYIGLTITAKHRSNEYNGYDTIELAVPDQGEDFLPNFRQGDMVYLYSYTKKDTPDMRHAILFKGYLTEIHHDKLTVHLCDGLQNPDILEATLLYAIEACKGNTGSSAIGSLYQFVTSALSRKQLLLGQRPPERDCSLMLSRSYNPNYDPILLQAKQARDYYLLVGPPGTGKTSMALRFMVEEELTDAGSSLLLMSYTNRAVDEICEMLSDAGIEYIRIGNEYSCAPRFRSRLLSSITAEMTKLADIKRMITEARVLVGTTATMMSRQYLFRLKHFSLAIIDESSQILEPDLIGLLAAHSDRDCQELAIRRFVLIGDHKQLPAVVQQSVASSTVDDPLLQAIHLDDCRNSLFERLIKTERSAGRTDFIGTLRKQGRMHPDIADFPNRMFYRREQLQPVPCPHQEETSLHYDAVSLDSTDDLLKSQRMIYIESPFCKRPYLSEKVNPAEADIVADLVRRIHRFYGSQFDADKTVGVIVPYRNQIAMIRKRLEQLGIPALSAITIDTVERYQGSQRDVIIYSFTVQNHYQLGFLAGNRFEEDGHVIDRKLNVAITRARKQMIITGNRSILSADPIFHSLISYIESHSPAQ